MTRTANLILNDLAISSEIRQKIDFIKNAKLDYNTFNEFRFLMQTLENFDINSKMSEARIRHNINNFVSKLINDLDVISQKIEFSNALNSEQPYNKRDGVESVAETFSSNLNVFDILARLEALNNFGDNVKQSQIEKLLSDINSIYNDASDDMKPILDETASIASRINEVYFSDSQEQESENEVKTKKALRRI